LKENNIVFCHSGQKMARYKGFASGWLIAKFNGSFSIEH